MSFSSPQMFVGICKLLQTRNVFALAALAGISIKLLQLPITQSERKSQLSTSKFETKFESRDFSRAWHGLNQATGTRFFSRWLKSIFTGFVVTTFTIVKCFIYIFNPGPLWISASLLNWPPHWQNKVYL